MKNFLGIVKKAVESMGNGPYDDKKTEEYVSKATSKTIAYCEKLKERKIKGLNNISNIVK